MIETFELKQKIYEKQKYTTLTIPHFLQDDHFSPSAHHIQPTHPWNNCHCCCNKMYFKVYSTFCLIHFENVKENAKVNRTFIRKYLTKAEIDSNRNTFCHLNILFLPLKKKKKTKY